MLDEQGGKWTGTELDPLAEVEAASRPPLTHRLHSSQQMVQPTLAPPPTSVRVGPAFRSTTSGAKAGGAGPER